MNLGEARFAGETVRQSQLLRSRITKKNRNTKRPGQGPPRNPGSPRPEARRHGPDKHNTTQVDPRLNGLALASAFQPRTQRATYEERVELKRSKHNKAVHRSDGCTPLLVKLVRTLLVKKKQQPKRTQETLKTDPGTP